MLFQTLICLKSFLFLKLVSVYLLWSNYSPSVTGKPQWHSKNKNKNCKLPNALCLNVKFLIDWLATPLIHRLNNANSSAPMGLHPIVFSVQMLSLCIFTWTALSDPWGLKCNVMFQMYTHFLWTHQKHLFSLSSLPCSINLYFRTPPISIIQTIITNFNFNCIHTHICTLYLFIINLAHSSVSFLRAN